MSRAPQDQVRADLDRLLPLLESRCLLPLGRNRKLPVAQFPIAVEQLQTTIQPLRNRYRPTC